jgi:Zn-finger nucleic acid-binding protein
VKTERCPKCGAAALAALEGSVIRSCVTCHGFWVPPAALAEPDVVQRLKERDLHPAHPLEQDHRTGVCPEGHGLLRRARASNDDPYFIERCARCGGLWFDPGEWSRLADANLLRDVTSLWSPAWREHLSEEQNRASLESDLRRKLGVEIFELMERLVGKLTDPAQRALALAYLQQRLRDR